MAWYRLYFLDSGGRITAAENLEADTDGGAIDKARRVFAGTDFFGFELWQGSRLLHKESRAAAN